MNWDTLLTAAKSLLNSGLMTDVIEGVEDAVAVAPAIVADIEALLLPIKEKRAATDAELVAAEKAMADNDAALQAAGTATTAAS